ncbi:amino acid adenylation domain-containing protein [Streptomyces sp. NPDC006610]|uniref:amino acid adenylation domain-containing protein n=1 Tax=Streptomyces sp. NPDC006610 TaxID=3154584 RepID=UPI0033B3EB90
MKRDESQGTTSSSVDGLAEAFAAAAEAFPERIAVRDGDRSWTYRQLDEAAGRLAAAVRAVAPDPGRPVAILLERSAWMVAAALAVVRTGSAYVPLDAETPPARLELIVEDAEPGAVITSRSLAGRVPDGVPAVHVDDPVPATAAKEPDAVTGRDTCAYIIFTSGTTGRPKGVQVSHGNLLSLFTSCEEGYDFGPEDVWPLFHSFAFDLSVWEMWGALLHGGTVVVVPARTAKDPVALRQLFRDERVTVLTQTPTAFQQLWAEDSRHTDVLPLRWVIFAGEPLYFSDLRGWVGKYGDDAPHLVNMYGITETTVHASFRRVRSEDLRESASLIGRPLPDYGFLLVDDGLSEVPPGETGEIVVTGPGVALGYLNRPELHRERFVELPGGRGRGYRSGDLARLTSTGEYEYLGRRDDQIKIRGFRVELGEIRSALTDVPGVRHAAVTAATPKAPASPVVKERSVCTEITRIRDLIRGGDRPRAASADSTPRITAYIVRGDEFDPERLFRHLRERLPHYMIPAFVVPVDALPVNLNGKVDKTRLPAATVANSLREHAPAAHAGDGLPEAGAEATVRALVGLYEEVLGVQGVTADDSFFSVGGDSILALNLRANAEKRGLSLDLADIYALQTPKALAAVAEQEPAAEEPVAPFSLLSAEDRERLRDAAGIEDAYPVGTLQAGLLFHSVYQPGVNMYCDVFSFRLKDAYDHAAMERAIARLVDRHDILRTSFDLTGYCEPLQLVHRTATVHLGATDLTHLPATEQQAALEAWHTHEERVPYDWASPPLSRFHTHVLGEREFLFSMSFHDALLDGWSEASLMTELLSDYWAIKHGEDRPPAPRTARRYADFIALEQRTLRDPEARSFWAAELDGVEPTLLPRLVSGSSDVHEGTMGFLSVDIDPGLSDALDRAARACGVTVRHVLIAAHARVVATLTGRDDIVLSVMSNGRSEDEGGTEVYGLHLNMVPYRLRSGGARWSDLIRAALEKETSLLPMRRYPLAEIQRLVGTRELTDISFNYTHFHSYQRLAAQTGLEVLDAKAYIHTNFTLRAEFNRDPFSGLLALDLEGNMKRVSEQQLRRIAGLYRRTLESIAAGVNHVPTRRELLGEEEWRQLLAGFGDPTPQPLSADGWFQVFEQAVAAHADNTAARCGEDTLTYLELAGRVGRLADRLAELGAGPGTVVGLGAGRDLDFLTAAMAVMRTGAVYLPLPGGPTTRVAAMLRTSEAALLLSGGTFTGTLTAAAAEAAGEAAPIPVLDLREVLAESAGREPYTGPVPTGRDSAYVTFTSGSTGEPKGALIRHDGMLNHIEAKIAALDIADGDLVSQDAAATFDISVWQMLAPLTVGGTTVIYPDEISQDPPRLLRALADDGVTILEVSPSVLSVINAELAYYGVDNFPGLALRWVVCAGEALTPRTVNTFRRLLPEVRFLNMWGATEISDDVTHYEVVEDVDEQVASVQLGRPIRNCAVYVLDDDREPVPVGTPGELYVGGLVVGAGYLNDPERTPKAFVPDPFADDPRVLAYRTGDRARQLADGGYEFLGRIDSQLKIRGQRVELGEIEAALAGLDDLQESAVIARTFEEGRGKQLVAFYVPKVAEGTAGDGAPVPQDAPVIRLDVPPSAVRDRLARVLPRYAVPDFLIRLDELPRNTNGKVDTKVLATRDVGSLVTASTEREDAPATPTEAAVIDTWASVLRLDRRLGATSDFFELGGHSLHATQVMARLRDRYRVDLPLRTLFENPTPRALASLIERGASPDRPASLAAVRIPRQPDGTVEFPLAGNQASLWFLHQVDPDDRSYEGVTLLALSGRVDLEALRYAVDTLVDRHEILSVRFLVRDGVPYQTPAPEARVRLEAVEVTADVGGDFEARRAYVWQRAAERRFDLERGPLAVIRLYSFSATEHILEWSNHHVVSDGWSIDVAIREITEAYLAHQEGRRPRLPELTVQYGDYAAWQQEQLASSADQERAFWRSYLDGYPGELPLITDHERTEDRARTPGHATRTWDEDATRRLADLTRERRTTLFMLVQAATAVVMARFAQQPDVVLGTGVAGRAVPGTEHLLGFFANTLPCRYRVDPDHTAAGLLESVTASALTALEHQLTPFQEIVRSVEAPRRPGTPPLVQVIVTVDNYPLGLGELPGLTATLEQMPAQTSLFDLLFRFLEGDRLRLDVQYDATLFTAATVERLIDAVARVLDVFLEEPDRSLGTVPLATAEESAELARIWADVTGDTLHFSDAARTGTVADSAHWPAFLDRVEARGLLPALLLTL